MSTFCEAVYDQRSGAGAPAEGNTCKNEIRIVESVGTLIAPPIDGRGSFVSHFNLGVNNVEPNPRVAFGKVL